MQKSLNKNNFVNHQLRDALTKALNDKKIKVTYPKGYKKWKEKFDYFYNITKSVDQTLKIIYGPDGSADNYKGSLYNNSNFNIKGIKNRKRNKPGKPNKITKNSSVFNYIRNKPNAKQ